MSSNTEALQERIAELMAGGVHYYELRDSFINSGSMQQEFGARWASDVADEIDEVVKFIQSREATLKAEYEEKIREAEDRGIAIGKYQAADTLYGHATTMYVFKDGDLNDPKIEYPARIKIY